MVLFNYSTKEITAKIVFYGPGLCGKTTNLQFIYDNLSGTLNKGKMLSLATKTDRTLFFDFLPIDLGTIRGMRTRLQLYTVPGQVFYNTTRKLVLKGADGVVFVADSQKRMLDANLESFKNLEENLAEHDMKLADMPMIIQFNKRDLPDVASVEDLNAAINKHNAPIYEGVATTGIGVHETLKAITRLVLNSLKEKYADKREQKAEPSAQVMAAASAAGKSAAPTPARAATPRPAAPPAPEAPPFAEAHQAAPKIAAQAPGRPVLPPSAASLKQDPFAETPDLGLQLPDLDDPFQPVTMTDTPDFTDASASDAGDLDTASPSFEPEPSAPRAMKESHTSLLEVGDEPILEILDDNGGLLELADPTESVATLPELEKFEESTLDAPTPIDATEEIFRAETPISVGPAAEEDTIAPIPIPSLPDIEPESEGVWLGQDPADEIEAEGTFEAITDQQEAEVPEAPLPPARAAKPLSPGRFEDDRLSIPFEGGEVLPISSLESSAAQRVVSVPVGAQEINLPISLEIAGRRIDFQIKISLDLGEAGHMVKQQRMGGREDQAGRGARS